MDNWTEIEYTISSELSELSFAPIEDPEEIEGKIEALQALGVLTKPNYIGMLNSLAHLRSFSDCRFILVSKKGQNNSNRIYIAFLTDADVCAHHIDHLFNTDWRRDGGNAGFVGELSSDYRGFLEQ